MMRTSCSTTEQGSLLADSLIAVALLVSGVLLLMAGRILTDTAWRRSLSSETRIEELSRLRLTVFEEISDGHDYP